MTAVALMKLHHRGRQGHARSTGPYSLVTQQPLGGKAQSMASTGDEAGRWGPAPRSRCRRCDGEVRHGGADAWMYKRPRATTAEPGLPESFNVMVKELQSLGLDVELVEEKPQEESRR